CDFFQLKLGSNNNDDDDEEDPDETNSNIAEDHCK
ncbi:unnamed protein product, partial [Rotaria magnacalcarata]